MDIDKIIEANGSIYKTYFPGADVSMSYRLLSLREYKVYKSLRDGGILPPFIINELVFERCYFGNKDLINRDMPAGITITIGEVIMYLSGDCDSETLNQDISIMRQLHPQNTVFEYMRSAIVTAFPTYTISKLESLTRSDFLRYFVIAENVLSKQNEEYQKLNLKEIKTQAEINSSPANKIDFAKENRDIRRAVGHWKGEEAETQYHEERKQKPLTKEQLAKLDSRRG